MSDTSGEAVAIARAEAALGGPVTLSRLVADLRRLGVPEDRPVLVHSSLAALGWVAGGPHVVVDALIEAFGTDTTIAVPTQAVIEATLRIGTTRRFLNIGFVGSVSSSPSRAVGTFCIRDRPSVSMIR